MQNLFQDRTHAGQVLAGRLSHYSERRDVLVLALPRGGVPVAYEVASALHAPLDVFLVRKLGLPGREEFAMGAIASGGIRVINPQIEHLSVSEETIDEVAQRELKELERREGIYRGSRPPLNVIERTVILIDDGLATGSTMHAAVMALKLQKPQSIVVAVPVGAIETCAVFQSEVDELVCVMTPDPFYAVGLWYEHFPQITDEEVCALLERAAEERARTDQADKWAA
jgi:putative phosphoribosyl transferase